MQDGCVKDYFSIRRWQSLIAAAVWLLFAGAPQASNGEPQSPALSADKVKAAYLYNFAKFVNWPDQAGSEALVMCIEGAPAVYSLLLHDVNGTFIGQRNVVVRSLDSAASKDGCSLLYVDSSAIAARGVVPNAPPHALTVSDQTEFTRYGGMIGMFEEGNRFRFNINLTKTRAAGLRLSASLLQLAAVVESK